MRKNAKTMLGVLAICLTIGLSACQEEVYPDMEMPETKVELIIDTQSTTNDGGEDEGVKPR